MSMSREEARKQIKTWMYATDDMPPKRVIEAMTMASNALKSPSREEVQKTLIPCSFCAGALNIDGKVTAFYPMNYTYPENTVEKSAFNFCPICGNPVTETGVEMLMEKLKNLLEQH